MKTWPMLSRAGNAITYTQLAEKITETLRAGERTAKGAIKRATDAGAIRKNATGLYVVVRGTAGLWENYTGCTER